MGKIAFFPIISKYILFSFFLFRSSFHPFVFRLKLAIKIMVKREGMENLLLKYYEGETTEDETALVEEWLEASEENRRTARQVQTLGLAADMAQISSRLDVKKALEDVHRKMKQKKVNRYRVLFRGMQRAAAILFIPLMVSWSSFIGTRIKKRYI